MLSAPYILSPALTSRNRLEIPLIDPRLLRFVGSGTTAAAVLFAASMGLQGLGLSAFVATLIAYSVAFLIGYTLQRNWTFEALHAHRSAAPKYALWQITCALISAGLAQAGRDLGLSHVMASGLATVTSSFLSCIVTLIWVFPTDRSKARGLLPGSSDPTTDRESANRSVRSARLPDESR